MKSAIEKADIVLDVLLRHDESDSNIVFGELMDEIRTRWKEELQ
jgi:hypothetical protein